MSDTDYPWDQQPNETAPAFAAFRAYRDKAPNPSIRGVADELGISRSQLEKWSKHYGWERRVRAYMRAQDRAASIAHHADRKKMSDRHISISQALIAKGLERLTRLDASELKPGEAARFIQLGVDLEAKARGYATESLESLAEPILEAVKPILDEAEAKAPKGPPKLELYSFDDELAGQG